MTTGPDRVDRLRDRDPGEHDENPYEDTDISTLPEWWREAIEEFEQHGLRPYRPPRLGDGTLKHEVVEDIQREYDVEIQFVGVGVTHGDDWSIRVDDEEVAQVGHHRSVDGYSVFEIEPETLRSLVEGHSERD